MVVRRTVAVGYSVPPPGSRVAGLVLHAAWFAPRRGRRGARAGRRRASRSVGDDRQPARAAGRDGTRAGGRRCVDARASTCSCVSEITELAPSAELETAGLREAAAATARATPGADDTVTGTMVFSAGAARCSVDVRSTPTLGGLVVDTLGLRLVAVHPMSPVLAGRLARRPRPRARPRLEEHAPDLVVGDLNATPDHQQLRDLDDAGYRDSVELTNGGFQPTWPVNGLFGLVGFLGPVAPIDHVLVSDDWAVTETADRRARRQRPPSRSSRSSRRR